MGCGQNPGNSMWRDIMKKIMVVTLSAMFILVLFGCGTANHGSNSLAPSEEISADNNSLEEEIYEDIKENEDAIKENSKEEWYFLEGEGGWHQRVTDEHLKKAQYIFDQGIDDALESHCVLLYKDEARDFSLYYSFKSYQYDDYEDVLIVSNGKKTVVKGLGAWDRVDLREVASSYDIDNDGFEEIIIPVVTGTGTGYLQTSFFVFDSSDGVTYDELSVCNPEGIIYDGDSTNPLQNVSVDVDKNDGTVKYMLGNSVKYEGHVKGLIDFYSISKVRIGDSVDAQLTESGKLVFIAHPCFYGEEFVSGAFAFTGDTENDVCDIFYEIEYIEDGTFRCVSVVFDKWLQQLF